METSLAWCLVHQRMRTLGHTDPRLTVNGGAMALGHPLECSAARLVTTLVHELGHRPDARHALATIRIGIGQGSAMLLER